jgi:ABC-type oligopeptide transport system ATPase subunit
MFSNKHETLLGLSVGRPNGSKVLLDQQNMIQHLYLIGKSGTGKSTLLCSAVTQQNATNTGCCLLDPHGDLATKLAIELSNNMYWDISDENRRLRFNPLRQPPAKYQILAASGLLEAMKHIWGDAWGIRMEHILRNCFLSLLEVGGANLADVLKLLQDKEYRTSVVSKLQNPQVRRFWEDEYNAYPARLRAEAIAPIQNKIGALLSDPLMQKLLLGDGEPISFRKAMDNGETIIINLAKGKLGSDTSGLLGAMLVSQIALAAFSRADTPPEKRRPFFLYADEFQNFTTLSFAVMLSELRKYGVGLVLAHQYIHQLKPDIREAVFGNCGTLICFRIGASDAPYLVREFQPVFDARDLMTLPNRRAYIKMMINGAPSRPFCMETILPEEALRMTFNPFRAAEFKRTQNNL